MAQGYTSGVPIDTDGTLSANSDLLVPSQKATKTYVDTSIAAIPDASSVTRDINQVAHGLSVGNVIRFNGTIFVTAQADAEANAECYGIVSAVAGVDDFTVMTHGYVEGLSGLTAGVTYFLSEITPGLLTATPPSASGEVRKAQFIATSTTAGHYNNFVGYIIP